MNKIKYFGALMLASLSIFIACKKEEAAPTTAPKPSNTFSATIANKPWKADSLTVIVQGSHLIVTGYAEDGRTLTLDIVGLVAKKYDLNTTSESIVTLRDSNFTIIKDYDTRVDAGFLGSIIVSKLDTGLKLFSCTFSLTLRGLSDNKLISIENGVVVDAKIMAPTKVLNKIQQSDFEGIIEGARVVKVGNRDTVKLTGLGDSYRKGNRILVDYPYQGGILRFDLDSTLSSGFFNSTTSSTTEVKFMYISGGDTLKNSDGDFAIITHDRITNTIQGEVRYVSSPFGSFAVGDYVNSAGQYEYAKFKIVYPEKEFTITN